MWLISPEWTIRTRVSLSLPTSSWPWLRSLSSQWITGTPPVTCWTSRLQRLCNVTCMSHDVLQMYVMCIRHVYHMSLPCMSHVSTCMYLIYMLHVHRYISHPYGSCILHVTHIHVTCISHACHMISWQEGSHSIEPEVAAETPVWECSSARLSVVRGQVLRRAHEWGGGPS